MKKTILYVVVALVLIISTCFLCSCAKTCDVCGGTGEVECPECEGFGYDEPGDSCPTCGGDGNILLSLDTTSETCPDCGGTGIAQVTCSKCNGTGKVVCDNCNGQGKY